LIIVINVILMMNQ